MIIAICSRQPNLLSVATPTSSNEPATPLLEKHPMPMQKSLIKQEASSTSSPTPTLWLDLTILAKVEITSEDDLFPIDHAFLHTPSTGWRAASPGPQIIRLLFHQPLSLHRIQIHIIDRAAERSQEFVLFTASPNHPPTELRRQQFTFSPNGSTEELEDYTVDLPSTSLFELRIDPDRAHNPRDSRHFATLTALKLA